MSEHRVLVWIALLLTLSAFGVAYASYRESSAGKLHVSFLDVGQGDAILVVSPTGRQLLIDGGAGPSVLRALGAHIPWYDGSIDAVIGTHPDTDHIGGLVDVLSRYRVPVILYPDTQGFTDTSRAFIDQASHQQARGSYFAQALRGEQIDLGGGAYLEVLFPDRSLPNVPTNTGCVVSRLTYGSSTFLFMCDAPKGVEKYLLSIERGRIRSDVLHVGHHGSKTSSDQLFVGAVDPRVAVISRGCENRYGHPSSETLATFSSLEIPVLDTCVEGTVTFVSDGREMLRVPSRK